MPVFISYRHPDRLDAFVINERLKLEGINTCLELFDPQARQTTDDICTLFNTNINACTHMITVLGQGGTDEWWIPFSLGSATQLNRRLAFYQCEGSLPGYLERWPILTRREHIDLFVSAYHDEQTFRRAISKDAAETNRNNAEFFHTDLKARLRRCF